MFIDGLELADKSFVVRRLMDPSLRGTNLPVSASDGDMFELTEAEGNKQPGIYTYSNEETSWVLSHPNSDLLPYDIGGSVHGTMTENEIIMRNLSVRDYAFQDSFYGSLARAEQAASVDTYLEIIKIGRQGAQTVLGSILFSASVTEGSFIQEAVGVKEIGAGETLIVKAPAGVNQSLAGITFTFAGALL